MAPPLIELCRQGGCCLQDRLALLVMLPLVSTAELAAQAMLHKAALHHRQLGDLVLTHQIQNLQLLQ